jgi:hypothetical protein
MSYVIESYYEGTYVGVDAGTDFARLAARASDDITLMCPMQVKDSTGEALDLTVLSVEQIAALKKATCAQIEWYAQNGDDYNESGGAKGAKIGAYSEGSGGGVSKKAMGLAPRAHAYLEQSGLMARGVKVHGYPRYDAQGCYCDE